ncbi:MAG: transcriptional regulator [Candidatus Bathyarchaeia archaeon]|nr:transcriptional regulator [Candidatus Bathyarchaeota archaeon]
MSRDQVIGALLLVVGVLGIIIYGWLVFLSQWSMLVLQLTGFVAVAAILAIVSWIGYTLATTPPPKPIEEIEKEVEEELKKTEEASGAEGEKAGGEEERKE